MIIRALFAACVLVPLTFEGVRADEYAKLPSSRILPKGTIKVSETVPGMGEHWADPRDLPLGPIYCVHKGKVVCIEYMISQADFQAGKSWPALSGLKTLPAVNHINVGFEPKGHEGYEIPHYDMHVFFVSPEAARDIGPAAQSARAGH